MADGVASARDTQAPAPGQDPELLALPEHRVLVHELPYRLQAAVAVGVITAEEADAWIAQAHDVLARRTHHTPGSTPARRSEQGAPPAAALRSGPATASDPPPR